MVTIRPHSLQDSSISLVRFPLLLVFPVSSPSLPNGSPAQTPAATSLDVLQRVPTNHGRARVRENPRYLIQRILGQSWIAYAQTLGWGAQVGGYILTSFDFAFLPSFLFLARYTFWSQIVHRHFTRTLGRSRVGFPPCFLEVCVLGDTPLLKQTVGSIPVTQLGQWRPRHSTRAHLIY